VYTIPANVNANAVLFSLSDAASTLAKTMVLNASEGNIDMAMDMPNEYNTKNEFEEVFKDLNLQALDMLPDIMYEVEQSIRNELTKMKYTAKVVRMDYKEDGELDDVTVKLDFI
jgi:hypothetical protein